MGKEGEEERKANHHPVGELRLWARNLPGQERSLPGPDVSQNFPARPCSLLNSAGDSRLTLALPPIGKQEKTATAGTSVAREKKRDIGACRKKLTFVPRGIER